MFEHLIGKVPRAADRFERAATASQFQRAERAAAQMLNSGHQRLAVQYRERAEKAEAANKALREDARPFPMQDGPPIPWSLAKIIYAGYSALFGTNQSLERLAERGGFGWSEVSGIYNHPRTRAALDAASKGG